MRFASAVYFSGLLAAVSAHFQLQYPPPRGDFVEDDEPTFCDGFVNAVSNRTVFPTTGGKISINSEHPQWTLGGIIATVQNPDSFDNFTVNNAFQYVVPFFKTSGEGSFCLPLDLAAQNISGVKDGANVTIQLIFDGGDGQLYQCADLTLSDSASIPDSVSCTNATDAAVTPVATVVATPTATSPGTSTASASATQTSNAASAKNVMGLSGVAGVLAAVAAML